MREPLHDPIETALVATHKVDDLADEASIELRPTDDDRLALLAYTSPEELARGCGPRQPWVAVPLERLDELCAATAVDIVLWDEVLDEDMRH